MGDSDFLQNVLDNCNTDSFAANPNSFCEDFLTFRDGPKCTDEETCDFSDPKLLEKVQAFQPPPLDILSTVSAEETRVVVGNLPRGTCSGDLIPLGETDAPNPPVETPTEAPVVSPTIGPAWQQIFFENFENGWDLFYDGGINAKINSKQGYGKNSASLLIRKKGSKARATTTNEYTISTYSEVKVSFYFKTANIVDGQKFFLKYSVDNGATWKNMKVLEIGVDYQDNGIWTEQSAS